MLETKMKTRVIHKHDIEANWEKAVNFIPKQAEIIVYDKDDNYAYQRLKIGDGETNVNDLPFISGGQADWEQNDENGSGYIKNRPFYETPQKSFHWDGEHADGDYVELYGLAMGMTILGAKVSDNALSMEQLKEGTLYDRYGSKITVNPDDIRSQYPEVIIYGEHLLSVLEDVFQYGANLTKGLYFTDRTSNFHYPKTFILSGDIKTLDRKYISYVPGENVEGKTFNPYGAPIVAKQGAEIFNNYDTNIATGINSHAEGNYAYAVGNYSHAEGYYTGADKEASHAEGYSTTAAAEYAHAEGYGTRASGYASHAEGGHSTASGFYSHVEGLRNTASGDYSHAEGSYAVASGTYSHAEGYKTKASNSNSHAEGYWTEAKGSYQHVQGKYNVADSGTYAHIVGNGTSDFKRSNAHTLDWSGNAWFAGDVYVKGTSQNNGSVLATKSYVDEHTAVDENKLWSEDDRNIFSNITSENYVNNNGAIKLLDAGNSPIKNLVVTAKEKTNKVYLTICGKNIANINKKVENTPSLSGGAVLPAVLPFTLGTFSGEINSSSILPQYLPFVLNVNKNSDNKTNNILLPVGKIILYINEGYKFSVDLLKNNTPILRKSLITELLIDNSDNKYDEMQVSFDNDDIDKVKFMAEIGETATGYEPYRGYTVVYETSFTAGETIDLTDELQNFNTVYGVTNVISNCNVSFDYNQLKEINTDGWLYSRGGKVITTLATDYECGLMSSEDKKKLNSFAPATDAEFAEMMASLDLIDVVGVNGSVLTDDFDNVITL